MMVDSGEGGVIPRRQAENLDRRIAAGIALLVAAVGLTRVGDTSFWLDEASSAVFVDRPLTKLVEELYKSAGMGPYYLTLWVWAHLGDSAPWLRMLSVFGGAFTAASVFLVGRRIHSRLLGGLATAALVCHPTFLRYLTEARTYSWSMFLAAATTTTCLTLRFHPSRRAAIAFGATVGLSLASLVFSIGVIAVQIAFLWPLTSSSRFRRHLLEAAGMATLTFTPFVPALLTSNQLNWMPATTPARVAVQTNVFLGGTAWSAAIAVGAALMLFAVIRRSPPLDPFARAGLLLCLGGAVAGPISLIILSVRSPVFIARYLTPSLPLLMLASSAGVVATVDLVRRRVPRGAAYATIAASLAIGFPGELFTDSARDEQIGPPATFITLNLKQGDSIFFEPSWLAEPFTFYLDGAWIDGEVDRTSGCRTWMIIRQSDDDDVAAAPVSSAVVIQKREFDGYTVILTDQCPGDR